MGEANSQSLVDPTTEIQNGIITRYVVGVGLVILLYDLILTMQKEVSGNNIVRFPLDT